MNKITYSLNYRKPKEEYTPDEELLVCVRYYHKVNNATPNLILKKKYSTQVELSKIDDKVKNRVKECEKFACKQKTY